MRKNKEKLEKLKKAEKLKLESLSSSHDEEDWSWEEGEEEWEGTEEARETERVKKIARYRKRKILQEKTTRRAKHMVGCGPITKTSIDFFNEATTDYELSKTLAVK